MLLTLGCYVDSDVCVSLQANFAHELNPRIWLLGTPLPSYRGVLANNGEFRGVLPSMQLTSGYYYRLARPWTANSAIPVLIESGRNAARSEWCFGNLAAAHSACVGKSYPPLLMRTVAEHIRHRFFFSKSSAR